MVCGPVQVVWHKSGENTIMVVPTSSARPSPGSPPPAPTRTSATANPSWTPVAAGRITAGPGL
jgi:hypothetical protein